VSVPVFVRGGKRKREGVFLERRHHLRESTSLGCPFIQERKEGRPCATSTELTFIIPSWKRKKNRPIRYISHSEKKEKKRELDRLRNFFQFSRGPGGGGGGGGGVFKDGRRDAEGGGGSVSSFLLSPWREGEERETCSLLTP